MDDTGFQTQSFLLLELREPGNRSAWDRFIKLYTPLLFYWARKAGLQEQDASDLVQDVFELLLKKMPEFDYVSLDGKSGRFRAWLRTLTLNKWRERRRKKLAETADPSDACWDELRVPDDAEAFWQKEYDQFLTSRALEIMKAEFEPNSWKACWETTVEGRKAAEVAAELGMTEGAVFAAKSRVLKKLRLDLAGILED